VLRRIPPRYKPRRTTHNTYPGPTQHHQHFITTYYATLETNPQTTLVFEDEASPHAPHQTLHDTDATSNTAHHPRHHTTNHTTQCFTSHHTVTLSATRDIKIEVRELKQKHARLSYFKSHVVLIARQNRGLALFRASNI